MAEKNEGNRESSSRAVDSWVSVETSDEDIENRTVTSEELNSHDRTVFQSTFGALFSCMGSAVGTGNIWRFPRILASQSYDEGALTFFIAWVILLFLWSIPVTLVEYAMGRFTQNSPPAAYAKFWGKRFIWIGIWFVMVVFFISSYYQVIIGWCLYYLYASIALPALPASGEEGLKIFNAFAVDSQWPVLTQIIGIGITGVFVFGGIRWIEKGNLVMVPTLLAILVFMFGWSLTRAYADVGINFLFTPLWSSFGNPDLWIAAASQNAFDTSAGMGVLFVYAAYMSRSNGIVRFSIIIPILNNLTSFFTSITIFSTAFSSFTQTNPTMTRSAIIAIIKDSGPGTTGLTFTWLPVLFGEVGPFGRFLSVLFFLSLSFAGITSMIPLLQTPILCLKEFGVPHRIAVAIVVIVCILAGIPCSLSPEFLANQDNAWAYGLVISGLLLYLVVIFYKPFRFLRNTINDFGTNDWKVPKFVVPFFIVVVPIEAILLVAWWIYGSISADSEWYLVTYSSLTATLIQWVIGLAVILLINLLLVLFVKSLYAKAGALGYDPYDPLLEATLRKGVDDVDSRRAISSDSIRSYVK